MGAKKSYSAEKWTEMLQNQQPFTAHQPKDHNVEIQDFPTPKAELWKWSDLRDFSENPFPLSEKQSFDNIDFIQKISDHGGHKLVHLVFVDGFFMPEYSDILPQGVSLKQGIKTPITDEHLTQSVLSLTQAISPESWGLSVEKNVEIQTPIALCFYGTQPKKTQATWFAIHVGQHAKVKILKTYISNAQQKQCDFLNVQLESDAVLDMAIVNQFHSHNQSVSQMCVKMQENSVFKAVFNVNGSQISRNEISASLQGQGANFDLSAVIDLKNEEKHDFSVQVQHQNHHGHSVQNFRSLVSDHARSAIHSKAVIDKNTKENKAEQLLKGILLSPFAQHFTKPELEIWTDDVACSHGSTTGQLDAQALYYLQSRGIPFFQAKQLLINAFCEEIFEKSWFFQKNAEK